MISTESASIPGQEVPHFLEVIAQLGGSYYREFTIFGAKSILPQRRELYRNGEAYTGIVGGIRRPIFNREAVKVRTTYSFLCLLLQEGTIQAFRKLSFVDEADSNDIKVSGYVETFKQGTGLTRLVDEMSAKILQEWSDKLQKDLTYEVIDLHAHQIRTLEQNIRVYSFMDTPANREAIIRLKEQRVRWLHMYGPQGTSPLLHKFVPTVNT